MRYEIKNGTNKTYYFRKKLKEFGCQFKKTGKYSGYWFLNTEDQFLANRLYAFCKKKGLTFMSIDSSYTRNAHYRADFFATNKPIIKDDKPYYRCVYCGKLVPKNKITIDHLYPIHKVKKSINRNFNRQMLKKFEIYDINDCKNLVPACSRCNKRKSKKTGIWLLRGYFGNNPIFWTMINVFLVLFCIIGILIIVSHLEF